jgi:exopolyphosphatase/guanosine-5'-triphosphate,3'-diphosphate pyrophosphatase
MGLAERSHHDRPHSRHVADLALALFDQTQSRHALGPRERALLEYASLLHDVGHHISYPGHHRHGYYLIKNGDLMGFDPMEIEIMASVARYHHGERPRRKHAGYGALPREWRRTVKVLAGCLRLADALDRSHRQVVRRLLAEERGGTWQVLCHAEADCELELWGGARGKDLLERVLGMPVTLQRAPVVASGTEIAASRT